MYLLFRYKNWEPQRYFDMGFGARQVVKALMKYEIEERNKEYEKIRKEGGT